MEINATSVTIPNQDIEIDAYLAQPVIATSKTPAVIVFQEIFGVNSNIREITELIAQQGYIAIAPALYQRLSPGFSYDFSPQDNGYSPEAYQLGLQYYQQVRYQEIISDIEATISYLKTLPNLKESAIACIGFCFGGHVAYIAATLADIKATASFYGAGITTACYGEEIPTLQRTAQIQGTIYLFFGTRDTLISSSENQQIEAELQKQQINHRIFRYNAGHGFFADKYPFLQQHPSYNPVAAPDAWAKVLDLFEHNL